MTFWRCLVFKSPHLSCSACLFNSFNKLLNDLLQKYHVIFKFLPGAGAAATAALTTAAALARPAAPGAGPEKTHPFIIFSEKYDHVTFVKQTTYIWRISFVVRGISAALHILPSNKITASAICILHMAILRFQLILQPNPSVCS